MNSTALIPQSAAPPTLEEYVERLIVEKNFPDLPPDVQTQIKEDLLTKLNDTINAKVIAQLSESDLTAFEKMLDAKATDTDIQTFVSSKIPDGANFLAGVLLEFRKTYLGLL